MELKSSKKREAIAIFSERFEQLGASKEGWQNAYTFEESYVKFVEQTNREVLQQVVGVKRDSRKNDKQ